MAIGKKGDGNNHKLTISRSVYSLNHWDECRHHLSRGFRYTPDLAWKRMQLMTLYSPKIRHVWGKALHNIILEGMNAAPLIQAYQAAESPMCIGFQYYKKLPHLIQHVLKSGNDKQTGIGLDVSGFDQSPQLWLIEAAFDILSENISFSDEKAALAWKYSIEFFTRMPVVNV